MKILVDKEGVVVIRQLCDIALKFAGIQNLDGVVQVLNNMRIIGSDVVESDKPKPSIDEKPTQPVSVEEDKPVAE